MAPVFLQESRLTTDWSIYSCILARVCAVAMAMGLIKNKAYKMVFVYFKKNPVVRWFSSFAHYVSLLVPCPQVGDRAGISGFRNHLCFYGMGWLAPCPTPNLEGQGFLSGYPSLSHNIPLFERRRTPAFCRCRSAAVQLHYRGYDEDMRQPTWWQSLWHGGHFPAFTKYTWWPQCTPPGPLTTLQPLAHYELTLNRFCRHCSNKILT